MRIAYADPPYIGQAKKHYDSEEVDHQKLISHLEMDFDSWALSCSTPSLKELLPLCPDNVRIAAWVKPFCIFKPNVNPAYAWEPVLFKTTRKRDRDEKTVRDWVSANITVKKGLSGAKPEDFCYWLFGLLGMEETDEFFDLYPGTGIISQCWKKWKEFQTNEYQMELNLTSTTTEAPCEDSS